MEKKNFCKRNSYRSHLMKIPIKIAKFLVNGLCWSNKGLKYANIVYKSKKKIIQNKKQSNSQKSACTMKRKMYKKCSEINKN